MQVSQTLSRTIRWTAYGSSTKHSTQSSKFNNSFDCHETRNKFHYPSEASDLEGFFSLGMPMKTKSYPQLCTPSSFALGLFICENLMYESNKSSKKVSWMTQLLTLDQVARQLSVSKRTVQRWVSQGRLETLNLSSGVVRVTEKAFERFIERQQREQRLSQGVKRG